MQLFQKFFNNLFYPFFIGITITIVFVIVMININTFNTIDQKTSQNIISIEKKHSEININTITIILLNDLLKIQLGMQQQILLYEEIAKKVNNSDIVNKTIQDYLYNYYDLKEMNLTDINLNSSIKDAFRNKTDFFSSWFVDQYTRNNNLTDTTTDLYKQLLIYSYLIQSIYSFRTSIDIVTRISFYFESTNLYITFPYDEHRILNNTEKLPWCTDENGNIYNVFNFKCNFEYEYIRISDDTICDINNEDQKNRTIFIFNAKRNTSPYYNENYAFCIRFKDILTDNKSDIFLCADINNDKIFNLFEDLNRNIKGSFVITSVGFQNMFFYPNILSEDYDSFSELIYKWTETFYLTEKIHFMKNIQRKLTSNYYKYIKNNRINKIKNEPMELFKPIILDDVDNFFYLNGYQIFYISYIIRK